MDNDDRQVPKSKSISKGGLVGYAFIAVLVVVAVMGILSSLGGKVSTVFSAINSGLEGPNTTITIQEAVDNEIKKLTKGKILFNPPQTMLMGVEERVEARITKVITEDLTIDLKGSGVPITRTITTGTFMTVALSGGNDFDIKALNSPGQIVGSESFTEWSWNVTPLKSGKRTLTLVATVRIKLPDGKEEVQDVPVIDEAIQIRVNPIFTVEMFLSNYWQWLAAGMAIPLFAFFGRRYLEQRKTVSSNINTSYQSDTLSQTVTRSNIEDLIATKTRRLRYLEQQQAFKGTNTPPEVFMEIEDLRRELAELARKSGGNEENKEP